MSDDEPLNSLKDSQFIPLKAILWHLKLCSIVILLSKQKRKGVYI